jgi:hypothetical protein
MNKMTFGKGIHILVIDVLGINLQGGEGEILIVCSDSTYIGFERMFRC